MNAERLLAHYERIADAPDAIARLRRFILDLAVRGKLVSQDPKDEPASELLSRIAATKAEAETKSRQRKSGEPFEDGATSFDPPLGWVKTPLGRIVTIRTGKLDANAAVKGGKYPFFTCSQTPSEIDSYSFDTGAVLLAGNGDFNLKVYKGKFDAYQRTYVIEPIGWDLKYCFILIRSQITRITDNQRGSAIPYLKLGDIASPIVFLPPLAEQKRIVAKVDELIALCDQLEKSRTAREETRDRLTSASLARLNDPDPETFQGDARFALDALPSITARPDQVKQLRQTILNLAVRGKLVPQDDPSDELVVRSDAESADDREPPFPIPSTWRWSPLSALGVLRGGGTPSKSRDDFWNGDIPWVSPKDMKVDYITKGQMSITKAAVADTAVQLIEPNSVLFVVRGMILAHSFPVAISRAPLTINQDMKALVLRSPAMAEYLLRALKGLKPEMLARVQRSSHGTCRIEGSDYANFMVPVPSLAEQRRIVAKVDELMSLCDRLEAILIDGEGARSRLLDALLHEAVEPVSAELETAA